MPRLWLRLLSLLEAHLLKPATYLVILYADRRDRRKLPGVPGAAIAIFRRSPRSVYKIADIWNVSCGVNVKTKDCAGSQPFQHKLQHHCFHGKVS